MGFAQNLRKDAVDDGDSVADGLGCAGIGFVIDTFDGLKCIADAVVHPGNGLQTLEHFDLAPSADDLPVRAPQEGEEAGQDAADDAKWAFPVHPVVIDEPLNEQRGGENSAACDERFEQDGGLRCNLPGGTIKSVVRHSQ